MADLVRLAHYPFLPEVRDAVRASGIQIADLLASPLYDDVRARAVARVEGALGDGWERIPILDERSALMELLSIPVSRMLVAALGERVLLARLAACEARPVGETLARRGTRPEELAEAAAALGVAVEQEGAGWRLHISSYLAAAPAMTDWKLVLRTVAAGHVILESAELARLLAEALQRRTLAELEAQAKSPLPDAMRAALAPLADSLKPKLEEAKANWSTGDFGPVRPELFPPCVHDIFESLKRNENVPHHGRFAFATFLHTVGWSSEQILDYLAATPNFDREKSRYQIEHVTGEKSVSAYTPPGCATMQTNGVCPLDKRDGLCFKIKHPLSYYRAKLRSNPPPTPPTGSQIPQIAQKGEAA
ncbi:MAG: DNA primase large subunit PriL [Candidatus Thermoplasmatota archaeon]